MVPNRDQMIEELLEVLRTTPVEEIIQEWLELQRDTLCDMHTDELREEYKCWVEENEAWQLLKRERVRCPAS